MSSVTKTLELLAYFSVTQPEIGLSQLCRLAKRDKATTHRHLQALEEAGFVEQNPATRQYRLGPLVLHLARVREATVPREAGAKQALTDLAQATGETTHVSVLSGVAVYPLVSVESDRNSTRVIIDIQKSPLHATASGLCALAFGPTDLMKVAATRLDPFTAYTATRIDQLEDAVKQARETGIARTHRTFEADVSSLAAPIFDASGGLAGAVSVACVATRLTPDLDRLIPGHLVDAARSITRNWGGRVPDAVEASWSLTLSSALETAS